MSNAELKLPQWQGSMKELIPEFDPQKMTEKIRSAETLVLERLQQLHHGNDSHVEKIALHDALRKRRGNSGSAEKG